MWPAVTVGVNPNVEDAVFVDVDGDGTIDVISATEGGNRQLMINFSPTDPADYTNSSMWTTVAFSTLSAPNVPNQIWIYSLVMDVNQDGNLDVVSGGKDDAKVGWFEAPEINKRDLSKWQYHEMGDVGWTMSLIESDMDGDSDIVLTDRHTDFGIQGARWLENSGSDGDQNSLWTNHFIGTQYEQTMSMTFADMDGDMDLDVVIPISNDQRVLWLERLDATGDSWTEHVINGPANVGSGKAVEVADVNNDGQLDLILSFANAVNGRSGVVWLEYSNSVFDSDWVRHEISGPDGVKFDLVAMLNLDYDGNLDLVTTEERGSDEIPELGVIWYENPHPNPLSVSIATTSIPENGGATTATMTRTDTTGALMVNLFSDDTTEATVVASVNIPDGQATAAPFAITAVDDAILDGTQKVTITASANGFVNGINTLDVTSASLPPTLNPIADLVVSENSVDHDVSLTGISVGATGTFVATTNFAVDADPQSVSVGDFDGDGNRSSDNVSILLGDGESQALTITATSDKTSLIPNPAVTYHVGGIDGQPEVHTGGRSKWVSDDHGDRGRWWARWKPKYNWRQRHVQPHVRCHSKCRE